MSIKARLAKLERLQAARPTQDPGDFVELTEDEIARRLLAQVSLGYIWQDETGKWYGKHEPDRCYDQLAEFLNKARAKMPAEAARAIWALRQG